jgi:hypothetical protein
LNLDDLLAAQTQSHEQENGVNNACFKPDQCTISLETNIKIGKSHFDKRLHFQWVKSVSVALTSRNMVIPFSSSAASADAIFVEISSSYFRLARLKFVASENNMATDASRREPYIGEKRNFKRDGKRNILVVLCILSGCI